MSAEEDLSVFVGLVRYLRKKKKKKENSIQWYNFKKDLNKRKVSFSSPLPLNLIT